MKNKLFWPIIVLTMVIMVESVLLMSDGQNTKKENNPSKVSMTEEKVIADNIIDFSWSNDEANKAVLIMTANKKVAIDAIDLYIAYKGVIVNSVENLNQLPEPTFSKVSTEKSLVVMNYLITDAKGFYIEKGQSIRIAQLDLKKDSVRLAELSIDPKTQVVENGSVKVLPFNSKSLIVNSDSL